MNSQTPIKFAFLLLLGCMFILPFYSAEGYSIIKNTTSQLGAQHTSNSWIMNFTFVSLGLSSVISGWKSLSNHWLHKLLLLAFGISLSLTAFFHHASLNLTLPIDWYQDNLHSIFASITGFSFTMLAISTVFISKTKFDKILALSIGFLSSLLSMLMFSIPELMGIWQRIIFISSFAWMIYTFKKLESIES